jgi:predicted amidohydrolase
MPKAGVAQFTGSANWEENIAAVRRLAAKAAENDVNLLCFPELANTVYVPFVEDRGALCPCRAREWRIGNSSERNRTPARDGSCLPILREGRR